MLKIDLTQPVTFFTAVLAVFFVIALRYFMVAGGFYTYFYLIRRCGNNSGSKVSGREHKKGQYRREIARSMLTSLLFALAGAGMGILWQKGYINLYEKPLEKGWLYLLVSLPAIMLLHETLYYFSHRLMHHPSLYRYMHRSHHESTSTSPWTAFSFHPLESMLQALMLPAILLVLPVQLHLFVVYLTIMTVSSVINHLDIEIYPRNFHRHWLGRLFIGATHHSMHHTHFHCNYGLYFTFWDKLLRTETPLYEEKLDKERAEYEELDVGTSVSVSKDYKN